MELSRVGNPTITLVHTKTLKLARVIMSLYQAKHKARGRYGVIDQTGQWLEDFLGNKEQAIERALQLNQQSFESPHQINKATPSNKIGLQHFILTEQGWLVKGEQ